MFSKVIRTVYLYVICLISLFMVVGGLIAGINEIANIAFPSNYYSSSYYDNNYDSIKERQEEERRERNRNIKDVISSLSFVVVGLPIYLYNWNKIEKEKDINIVTPAKNESEGV